MAALTYKQAEYAIEKAIIDNWSYTAYVLENQEMVTGATPPAELLKGTLPFIATRIMHGASMQATVTNGCIRSFGSVEFRVFTRASTGTRQSAEYMDNASDIFEQKVHNSVTFKTLMPLADFRDGDWFITTFLIEFYFERTTQ